MRCTPTFGEVGYTIESTGGVGKALLGTEGRSRASKLKTRSFGLLEGRQGEYAENSTRILSVADFPGIKRAGGAEDKGGARTCTTKAQVEK